MLVGRVPGAFQQIMRKMDACWSCWLGETEAKGAGETAPGDSGWRERRAESQSLAPAGEGRGRGARALRWSVTAKGVRGQCSSGREFEMDC